MWTGSPSLSGNLTLVASTATAGNILKAGVPFIHNLGPHNTFIGEDAGNFTMTGSGNNTASGYGALQGNTTGGFNTASGAQALFTNTTGGSNTASGYWALLFNTTGWDNSAMGAHALQENTTGSNNTASGSSALAFNNTGNNNTASGRGAMYSNRTGSNNIAFGYYAGFSLTTGDFNIDIGNMGVAAEGHTIRLGDSNQTRTFIAGIRGVTTGVADGVAVVMDSQGQLGTVSSSRRVTDEIADMDGASAALMKLCPVTFHYTADHNPAGRRRQYGLIAEEVAEVSPDLVAYSADGRIETVMYQFLPPMLLNEYQKQQRTIEAQAAEIAMLKEQIAQIVQRQTQAAGLALAAGK